MCLSAIVASMAANPLMALSVGMSAVGAAGEASARKTEANYRASVAKNNVIIAQQNLAYTRKAERVDLDILGQQIRSAIGTTRAALAGSGIAVDVGGEVGGEAVTSVKRAGSFKTLQLRHDYELKRREIKQAEVKASAEGDLLTFQAGQISPLMSGFTAGMSSLSSGLLTAQQLKRYGPPGDTL